MIELNTLTKITQALQVCYVSSKSNIPLANKKPGISAGPLPHLYMTCLSKPAIPCLATPFRALPRLPCHPVLAIPSHTCHTCTGPTIPSLPCLAVPYLTCHTQADISPPGFDNYLFGFARRSTTLRHSFCPRADRFSKIAFCASCSETHPACLPSANPIKNQQNMSPIHTSIIFPPRFPRPRTCHAARPSPASIHRHRPSFQRTRTSSQSSRC